MFFSTSHTQSTVHGLARLVQGTVALVSGVPEWNWVFLANSVDQMVVRRGHDGQFPSGVFSRVHPAVHRKCVCVPRGGATAHTTLWSHTICAQRVILSVRTYTLILARATQLSLLIVFSLHVSGWLWQCCGGFWRHRLCVFDGRISTHGRCHCPCDVGPTLCLHGECTGAE